MSLPTFTWTRETRTYNVFGDSVGPFPAPTITMQDPMYASTGDQLVELLGKFEVPDPLNVPYVWRREQRFIAADGSTIFTSVTEDRLTKLSNSELWERSVNGGPFVFREQNFIPADIPGHTNLLDYFVFYQGLPPGTYEVDISFFNNGVQQGPTYFAGKFDLRGLVLRDILPDKPLNPEEEEGILLKADVYALPEPGVGRVFPNGWQPETPLTWRISLNGNASTPITNGNSSVNLQPSGKIATISELWDGKQSNGTYATETKGLTFSAVSPVPSGTPDEGNYFTTNGDRMPLFSRSCCEQWRLREVVTDAVVSMFSAGPLAALSFVYKSFDYWRPSASMGWGWKSHGSAKLRQSQPSGDFIYRDEGGMVKRWTESGGAYVPIREDNYTILEAGGTGAHRLTFKDQSFRDFDSNGNLVAQGDTNGNVTTFTYVNDTLLSVSDGKGRTLFYDYGTRTDNQPVAIRADDPVTGRLVQLDYYPDTEPEAIRGRLRSITDPEGEVTEFVYDDRGRLIRRIDVRPTLGDLEVEYQYRPNSELTAEIFQGQLGRFHEDPGDGRMRIWTVPVVDGEPVPDVCGRDTYFEVNDFGLVYNREDNGLDFYGTGCFNDTENRQTFLQYQDPNSPYLVTKRFDDNGAITEFTYKANGDLRSVEDALGNVTTYFYTEDIDPAPINPKLQHLVRKIQRADVTVDGVLTTYPPTEFLYDADANLVKVIDAKGNATEMTYSADGLILTVKDRRGHTSEMVYEGTAFDGSRRRLLQMKTPKGLNAADGFRTLSLSYNDPGNLDNVTSVTNDLGHVSLVEYDAKDRVIKQTDPRGKISQFNFLDDFLTEIELPPNNASASSIRKTGMLYDSRGRLQEVKRDIDASTQETRVRYAYNPFSEIEKLIRLKDTVEKSYSFTRDALGRVLTSTDDLQNVSTTSWENACVGNSQTSARGIRRKMGVDILCRLAQIDVGTPDPFDDYDIDELREVRETDYDELGRIVRTSQTVMPEYQKAVLGIDRYNSQIEERFFEHDELDRLVKMTFEDGLVMSYEHDAEGNVIKMTDPEGKVTRYEYLRDGLLHKVIVERPSQVDRVFTYSYDPAGRLDKIVYPASTGIEVIFRDEADLSPTGIGTGFDPSGNLRFLRYQKTDGALIRRFEWSYDDSNNRQSQLEVTPTKAIKWEYGFDWLDRLVTVKRAEAADVASLPPSPLGALYLQREYVWDESDNRTFFDDHVAGVTYHYRYKSIDDNGTTRWSDQLEEILIYPTAAGHRTVGDFVSFETLEHDADGNMTRRTIAATGEEIELSWSDFDRLKRVESDINGRMQDARYDVDGLRKRKLDKNGNSSVEHGLGITASVSKPGSRFSNAPTISYIQGAYGVLGCEIDDGTGPKFIFHLTDALSSVRDVVDETGAVIKSFEFDEYGNLLSATGSGITSPKTWIGGFFVNDDRADSGMFNMGHRNYASLTGRFISRDPIGHRGGLNLYAYPNPVTSLDPMGLEGYLAPAGCSVTSTTATGSTATTGATTTSTGATGAGGGTAATGLSLSSFAGFGIIGLGGAYISYHALRAWSAEEQAAIAEANLIRTQSRAQMQQKWLPSEVRNGRSGRDDSKPWTPKTDDDCDDLEKKCEEAVLRWTVRDTFKGVNVLTPESKSWRQSVLETCKAGWLSPEAIDLM